MSDIYFKDEGDFATVGLETDKAKEVFAFKKAYKFNVDLLELYMLKKYAQENGLTVDSEVEIQKPPVPIEEKYWARKPHYENEICRIMKLRSSCNDCGRLIYEDETYYHGGYCKECFREMIAENRELLYEWGWKWSEDPNRDNGILTVVSTKMEPEKAMPWLDKAYPAWVENFNEFIKNKMQQ